MKRLSSLAIVIAFIMLAFIVPVKAQLAGVISYDGWGTVANSVDETPVYYNFEGMRKQLGINKIDSLVFALSVQGEIDIDSLDVYPVGWDPYGNVTTGSVKHFTVTLNVAAGAAGYEVLYVTNAGFLLADWRNYPGFRVFTRGAAAGNDATDPNGVRLYIFVYGS